MTTIATYAGVTALASVKFMVAVGTAVALRFGFVEQLVTTAGGAIVGVIVTAYAGDAIRAWWRRFRKHDETTAAAPATARAWQKRLFERWGVVGLAVVGPPTLGPVFTVALALAFGASRHRATIVIASAVLVWGVIFAALSGWLQRFFG